MEGNNYYAQTNDGEKVLLSKKLKEKSQFLTLCFGNGVVESKTGIVGLKFSSFVLKNIEFLVSLSENFDELQFLEWSDNKTDLEKANLIEVLDFLSLDLKFPSPKHDFINLKKTYIDTDTQGTFIHITIVHDMINIIIYSDDNTIISCLSANDKYEIEENSRFSGSMVYQSRDKIFVATNDEIIFTDLKTVAENKLGLIFRKSITIKDSDLEFDEFFYKYSNLVYNNKNKIKFDQDVFSMYEYGGKLFIGARTGGVSIYDVNTMKEIKTLPLTEGTVEAIYVNKKYIILGDTEGYIYFYDGITYEHKFDISLMSPIRKFLLYGEKIIIIANDSIELLYENISCTYIVNVESVTFGNIYKDYLIIGFFSGLIKIYDLIGKKFIWEKQFTNKRVNDICIHGDLIYIVYDEPRMDILKFEDIKVDFAELCFGIEK